MIVPGELPNDVIATRTLAVEQARASIRLAGLAAPPEAEAIMQRWADGEITTPQMRAMTRRLAGADE